MAAFIFPPFTNKGGILQLDDVDVMRLVSRFGTPLLVTSEMRIRENFRKLRAAFSIRNVKFSVRYAIKANPNLAIISILHQEGAGADASSPDELKMARMAGILPEKIMFSPNNATREDLEFGIASRAVMNFDDIQQMELVSNYPPEILSFRINPGIGGGEFPGIITGGQKTKFGIPAELAEKAYGNALSLGVKRFGIHMMAGSNVLEWSHFDLITKNLFEVAGRISTKLGIEFEFIDIGGGFGVPYSPDQKPLNLEKTADAIISNLKTTCEKYGMNEPELVIEPGRFLVADSTVLLGKVTNIKSYDSIFVGTDIGMNILIRPALYGAYHHVVVANRLNDDDDARVNIVGQICENTDKIAQDRPFPKAKVGDAIAVFNAGAYTSSMSSNYNGHLRPAEILVNRSSVEIIRSADSFQDLVRNMSIPQRLLK